MGVSIKLVWLVVVVGRGFYEGFPALRPLKQREHPDQQTHPVGGDKSRHFFKGSGQKVPRLASTTILFYPDDGQRRPLKHSFPICVLTGCWIWHFSGSLLGQKIVKGDPNMAGVNVNCFYADDGRRWPLKHSFPVLTGCWIWHFSGNLLGQKIVKGDP